MEVQVLFSLKNIMHTRIRERCNSVWCLATWVYENPYRVEKLEFWNWLSQVLSPCTDPWFCGGDFNEFFLDHERSGGSENPHSYPHYLQEFMTKMELFDLEFSGPRFTWRGMRNNRLVHEWLDKGLVNRNWQKRWPNTTVIHGSVHASDHCFVIINFDPRPAKGKKIF